MVRRIADREDDIVKRAAGKKAEREAREKAQREAAKKPRAKGKAKASAASSQANPRADGGGFSLRSIPRWVLPAVLGVVALVLVLVLVTGGDDEAADGPAAVVPASAPLYVDLTLRPEGEAKTSAEAALGTILDESDPGAELISLIEEQAKKEGEEFDYEEDVEPWLGERFSVFLTKIGEDDESEGGFIIETTDSDAALEFINSQEEGEDSGEEKEYEGVDYTIDEDGDAFGLVGDFVVGGDEPAFKAAVDASDGEALAESDEFTDATGDLESDRLATLYVPVEKFLDAVAEDLDPQAKEFLERAAGDAAKEPVVGQMTASATDVTFELSAGGGGVETTESSLLEDLPAEAWLGLGLGDVGGTIDNAIDNLDDAGIDADTIRTQLQTQTGLELDAVTAALGEAAIYVQGRTVADLAGALVIQDKDQTVTANLLDSLESLIAQQSQGAVKVQPLQGVDAGFQVIDPTQVVAKPFQVVQQDGKIIAGYGANSVQQASRIATSPKTLAEEAFFQNARDAVGDLGVDAYLAIEPVLALAESEGATQDAQYQEAKPYLESLAFLAVGSGNDGDRNVVRFILGLR